MKHFLKVYYVFIMMFVLLGCLNNNKVEGLYCNSYTEEIDGSEIVIKDYIQLNADGTGYFDFQDKVNITWKDRIITDNNGQQIPFVLNNDTIILTIDNYKTVYKKVK